MFAYTVSSLSFIQLFSQIPAFFFSHVYVGVVVIVAETDNWLNLMHKCRGWGEEGDGGTDSPPVYFYREKGWSLFSRNSF